VGWKEILAHMVVDIENTFDVLKNRLHERLGGNDPVMIQAYRGFGTQQRLYVKGRVLEDEGIRPANDNDTVWENLVNMYRRFESDEIPHARVRVRCGSEVKEVIANEEGFFEAWIEPEPPIQIEKLWQSVELELLEPLRANELPYRTEAQVLVPPLTARFAVVSDIDDTVMQTDARHLLRMARNIFLGNARTRLPFKGVAAFYRALFHGASGDEHNPLFYISSSPWNLYDLISDFFHLQDIPIGPVLFLRDLGVSEAELLPFGHRTHKLTSIRKALDLYPDLLFILLGDSGQEDPEIYAELVELYPRRIQAIYIRDVSRDPKRSQAIQMLVKKVVAEGCTLILANNTLPMAEHAVEKGWISPEALKVIREEIVKDEQPPNLVESMLEAEG
jgi:phosphatidate phosphatase APP1